MYAFFVTSLFIIILGISELSAHTILDNQDVDSLLADKNKIEVVSDSLVETPKKKSFFDKFKQYFKDSNKEKEHKAFDFSIIGGPHYSTDTKLGLGLVGAGLYRMDRNDKTLPPSNVTLFGDISTVGFVMIGIRGTNIFPHNRYRLNYKLYLYSFPSYFWGIGYDNGIIDDNKTKMKRFQSKVSADFTFRLANNLYFGPAVAWDYVKGNEIEKPELLQGMDLCTRNYGAGLVLTYDSRDVLTNPSKGIYVNIEQMFRPSWLGNDYAFSSTEIRASAYGRVWKGGILAGEIRGSFNYGNPIWALMAQIGQSGAMRGYYEGRYRDKHAIQTQIELRQHVWRRNGIAVWLGTGTVFHDKESFKHFLPNYGIGYRWEFKKDMNIRLDVGFGRKGEMGFTFNVNEAF